MWEGTKAFLGNDKGRGRGERREIIGCNLSGGNLEEILNYGRIVIQTSLDLHSIFLYFFN